MLKRTRSFFSSNSIIGRFREFFSGDFYPPLIACMILFAYVTRTEVFIVFLLACMTSFAMLISRDLKCLIPALLIMPYCLPLAHSPGTTQSNSDYLQQTWIYVLAAIALFLLAFGLVMHYCLWGGAKRTFLKTNELTPYIAVLAVGLLCNGIGAEGYIFQDFTQGLFLVGIWIVLYMILLRGVEYNKKMTEYVCNICQWIAVLLILELLYVILTNQVVSADGEIIKDKIVFGWGINNNFGGILAWLIPPIFYLAITRKSGWVQLLLSLFCVAAIFFSMCRSGLVVGMGIYLVCLGVGCFAGKNKVLFRVFTVTSVLAALALGFFFTDTLLETFNYYLERGFSSSGRFELWADSWKNFLKYPIFGAGFHATPFKPWSGLRFGYCHNTVIQLFSAGGIVAGVSYLVMRAKTIWMGLYRTNLERIFLSFALAALLGVSLLDNHMFNIYPGFYYALFVAMIERDYVNSTQAHERALLKRLRSVHQAKWKGKHTHRDTK